MKRNYIFKSIIFIFFVFLATNNIAHYYSSKYFSYNETQISQHNPFGEITKWNTFSQELTFNTKNIEEIGGLNILAATYGRHNTSTLWIRLTDSNNHVIIEKTFLTSKIPDNSFISILFPHNYQLPSNKTHITILSDANSGNAVTVYVGSKNQLEYNLIAKMNGYTKHTVFNILLILYLLALSMVAFVKNRKVTLVVLAGIFGTLFIIIGPIGSVADEAAHFARAYTVANGIYVNNVTDKTPNAAITAIASPPKVGIRAIFDNDYKKFFINTLLPIDALGTNSAPGSAVYSIVNYIPQALGIKIAQKIYNNRLTTFYSARIVALVFYIVTIYLCLKISPEGFRCFLALVMLLPMTLYQAASLSADGMNFILIFIFISLLARIYFLDLKFNKQQLIYFIILSTLIGFCKPTLLIIEGILVILNPRLYGGVGPKILKIGAVFLVGFIALCTWMKIVSQHGITQSFIAHVHEFKQTFNSLGDAINYALHNPKHVIHIMLFSIFHFFKNDYNTIIGFLGWVSIKLDDLTYYLILLAFVLALSINNFANKINKNARLIGIGIISLFIVATFFIFYASWTELSAHIIDGVQGRYFIPLLPIFYFAFSNSCLVKFKSEIEDFMFMAVTYALFDAILALFNFYY